MKPKVAILFFAHEWFWNYKMFGSEFLKLLESDVANIENNLKSFAEVVSSGIILNESQAKEAVKKLKGEHVNLIILCPIVWSSDSTVLASLKDFDDAHPILMWCYNPYKELPKKVSVPEMIRASGAVGALQSASAILRLGKSLIPIVGREDEVLKEIYEYSIAAKLLDDLKEAKIGLLPWRYGEMVGTWIDEAKLLGKLGLKIEPISVAELYQASQELSEDEVNSFIEYLKKNFKIEVSEKSLMISAKASLALAKVIEKHSLDAIAMQDLDDEMHKLLKTRPSLCVESILKKGIPVGMEGDIRGTIAMLILQRLTGKPAMFGEVFTFDSINNTLLVGHIGLVNVNLAKDLSKVKIIPDCEYQFYDEVEGAYMYFTSKEGAVTLLSIVEEKDTFRMVIAKGESLPIEEKLEGYSHMLIKTDVPVRQFLKTALKLGATQHWAIVHDDAVSKLEKFAEIAGLEKTLIT
jgi:L-arabinose isomerase